MTSPDDIAAAGPPRGVTAGIGLALLVVGAVVLLDSQRLPAAGAIGVGPAAAMRIVAALVAFLGVCHLVVAARTRMRIDVEAVSTASPVNRAALGWVLGALAGLIAIVQFNGGFIAAATWLFVLTARGFGARLGVLPLAIGAGLAVAVYLFFTRVLSLALPAGAIERLLG